MKKLLCSVLTCALLSAVAEAQQFSFSTVALSGLPAPGTPAGVGFLNFKTIAPTINVAGQSAFWGQLTGAGVTTSNNTGLWSGAPGNVGLLARTGDPAPSSGANYSLLFVQSFTLNAARESVFAGAVANDYYLWSGTPGNVALLARTGDPAPGTAAGVTYSGFGTIPPLNAAGQSTFAAGVTGPGVTSGTNDLGLWTGTPGHMALLARTGDAAPGTAFGVSYSDLTTTSPPLNAAGQSAFPGQLTGVGVTAGNNNGLWVGSPGNVVLLARTGDHPPGTVAGVNYFFLYSPPGLNAAGVCAFRSHLAGTAVTTANDEGLWLGAPGSLALLARKGDSAPGTGPGVNYSTLGYPNVNRLGKSAFVAVLTGTGITTANDTGLWSGTPGSLSEIVYEGQTAPSGGNGTLFGDILSSPFAFNDRGEIAFYNFLSGPANNGSLWFWDGASLSMIARAGNSFQVAPGDTRIISSLLFAGGSADEDGLPCGLNDVGQVTFRAAFTDGSQGIFSATPAALIAALNKKTTVGKSGNAATITIDSVAAYSYQLQRSLSPAGAGFTNIGSSQSGSTGTKLTFTDPNATGSALFYRILLGGP